MAVLWKDRKRICGLPITFTKYRLEGERLYVTKGLLRTVEDETLLYRVLDISLERTLADKIFGVGTIVLHCADQTHPSCAWRTCAIQKMCGRCFRKRLKRSVAARVWLGAKCMARRTAIWMWTWM